MVIDEAFAESLIGQNVGMFGIVTKAHVNALGNLHITAVADNIEYENQKCRLYTVAPNVTIDDTDARTGAVHLIAHTMDDRDMTYHVYEPIC